jgi:hypothetical protein
MIGSKTIIDLKSEYIKYYIDLPVQRYAAMAIARDEDTIIRWRREDQEFADAVQRAKAEWVRKKVIATKAEFALERIEKEVFSPSATVEIYSQVQPQTIDPNSINGKKLVEDSLNVLMEMTKRKPSPVAQEPQLSLVADSHPSPS